MRAWATVLVLLAAYALAFVDRQILTLLVEPIKRDLAITDTQFSLLSGLAFTLFYTVMGVPFGWLADRSSRRNLITVSIVFWSAMTAVCGMANSFLTLFLARIGVGVGEAGLSPAAYSMIADSFPPAKRSRALSVYAVGAITGVGLALIIGGAVVKWALTAPPVVLPILGELRTWQLALLIVALPGPLLALVMLALREPQRQEVAPTQASGSSDLALFVRQRWRLFLLLAMGYSLIGVPIAAYLTWTPAFMIRVHGWDISTVGTVYGVVLLLFNTSGILLGGWLADSQIAKGRKDAALVVSIAGSALALPFAIAAPFAPGPWLAMACIAVMSFAFGIAQGLPAASIQAIAPNQLRARVMAVYFLIGNIIAFTVGPTGVAMISDFVLRDSAKIGVAIALLTLAVLPLGLLSLWVARSGFLRLAGADLAVPGHK
ncbi:MAG: spinster family MFS transporter [Caulobacterales bacterium]|jgi:MFS family permease